MMLQFMLVAVPATMVALLYNVVTGGAGYLMCRAVLGREWVTHFASAITPIVLCLALGQAVLGAAWQILAAHGLFNPLPVGAVLVSVGLGALISWRAAGWWRPQVKTLLVAAGKVPAYGWVLLLGLAFILAITWAQSFGFPDGDAMAFYLAQPKLIAYTGFFTLLADYESFAEIGLFAEMHTAAMFLAGGEMAARAWLWQAGVLLTFGVAALCAEAGLPSGARILGALIVLTSSAILFVMTDGKSDHVAAAWAVAALLVALTVDWRTPWRPVFLAALLGGLAALAKLSFLVGLPLILAIIVTDRLATTRPHRGIKILLTRLAAVGGVAASAALLAFAALAWKNYIVYSEPLAPFLYLNGDSSGILSQVWFTPENTNWIIQTYPIALTIGKYPMQHGNMSALMLAFLPILFLTWWGGARFPRPSVVLTLAALVGVAAWLILRPSVLAPRYILPQLLCLVPLLAGAADAWLRSGTKPFALTLVIVGLTGHIALIGAQAGNDWLRTQLYATGQNPDGLLLAGVNLGEEAAPHGRFLVASYYKSFMTPEVLLCTLGADEKRRLAETPPTTSAEMWERLYRNGVTDVLLYRPTHPLILGQKPKTHEAPSWLAVTEEVFSPVVSVFHLRPRNGAPPPGPKCEVSVAKGATKS